jgi:hypothetical protein
MPTISRLLRRKLWAIPFNAPENEYYGIINKILSKFFVGEGYVVCPQYSPSTAPSNTIDFAVTYNGQPVFFIEVKPRYTLSSDAARAEADHQMRIRFQQILPNCPLSALYGISIFGCMACVFCRLPFNNAILPPIIHPNPTYVTDVAPITRWGYDIRSKVRSEIITEVMELVREMCEG